VATLHSKLSLCTHRTFPTDKLPKLRHLGTNESHCQEAIEQAKQNHHREYGMLSGGKVRRVPDTPEVQLSNGQIKMSDFFSVKAESCGFLQKPPSESKQLVHPLPDFAQAQILQAFRVE
jgi:hypothetical protein